MLPSPDVEVLVYGEWGRDLAVLAQDAIGTPLQKMQFKSFGMGWRSLEFYWAGKVSIIVYK